MLNELEEKAIKFYKSLDIEIPENYKELAVQSLMMPQYAMNHPEWDLNDHRGLATVGDAICGAYLMLKEFNAASTMKDLTDKKKIVTNKHLNIIGEELLKDVLFAYNNDLKGHNKKSYATAFEAVIGFIAIIDRDKAFKILEDKLK